MSLICWYPLNGDLRNQGVGSATASGTPIFASTSRGQALKMPDTVRINFSCPELAGKRAFSFAFWGYHTTDDSYTANWQDIFGISTKLGDSTGPLRVEGSWSESLKSSYCLSLHNNAVYAIYNGDARLGATADTWGHVAFATDGTTCYVYFNGVLKYSTSNLGGTINNGAFYINTDGGFRGYISDLRIYDHCLSQKEVVNLSRGLIVHYPMNQADGVIIGKNLLKNSEGMFATETTIGSEKRYTIDIDELNNSTQRTMTLSFDYIADNWKGSRLGIEPSFAASSGYVYLGAWIYSSLDGIGRYSKTVAIPDSITALRQNQMYVQGTTSGTVKIFNPKLELGDAATPYVPPIETDDLTVHDVSGFGNHATYTAAKKPSGNSDAVLGLGSFDFGNDKKISLTLSSALGDNFTFSWWAKASNYNGKMCWGYNNGNRLNFYGRFCNTGDSNNNPFSLNGTTMDSPTADVWHHFVFTGNGTENNLYIDSALVGKSKTFKAATGTNIYFNGWNNSTDYNFNGLMSDFRIYTTALNEAAVKELYGARAAVDNAQNLYLYDLLEEHENLVADSNLAFLNNAAGHGVSGYNQQYCTCTFEDNKFHIYRPPNLLVSEVGNKMYGGLRFQPHNAGYELLDNHTYIIMMHVQGKTSNPAANFNWNNNMGWGGGGLMPAPTNVEYCIFPKDFDGEMECWYKFTISDGVYKVCTTSYSSFVEGTTYRSYRDFQLSFTYRDTGEMGTDLWIDNIRLYDITNYAGKEEILSSGILNSLSFSEYEKANIFKFGTTSKNLIEI